VNPKVSTEKFIPRHITIKFPQSRDRKHPEKIILFPGERTICFTADFSSAVMGARKKCHTALFTERQELPAQNPLLSEPSGLEEKTGHS
jgi:hypothetical protein